MQALDQDAYDELLAAAADYNRSLLTRENGFFLTEEQQAQYESLLDISGTGIMGYIEIPSIKNLSDSRRSRIQSPPGFQTLFSGGPAQYIVLRHVTQENDVGSGYPKLTKNPCLPEILSLSDFIPYICML